MNHMIVVGTGQIWKFSLKIMLGFFFLIIVEPYKAFAMGSFEPALTTFLLSFLKTDNSSTDYDKNSENIIEWHEILSNINSEVLRAQVIIVERIISSRYVQRYTQLVHTSDSLETTHSGQLVTE